MRVTREHARLSGARQEPVSERTEERVMGFDGATAHRYTEDAGETEEERH